MESNAASGPEGEDPRGRHVAAGSLKVLTAEALALPTGLLIAAYLARVLGPEDYGLFAVAMTVSFWFEVAASMVLARTTIKFVAEATDWRPVASAAARAQLIVGAVGGLVLALTASLLAQGLRSPQLTSSLYLLALGVPLSALFRVHSLVLVARGRFGPYAMTTAVRLVSRLLLTFLFVGMGLSVTGAILASVLASLIAVVTVRFFVRPALLSRSGFPTRQLWGYALPLFLSSIGIQLFSRLDLLVVQALSASPEAAGLYGAAQGITIVPGLLSGSVAPVVLATVSRLAREGRDGDVRATIEQVFRLVWLLLPVAGVVAGTGSAVAGLVYGSRFSAAGPLMGILMFAAIALTIISFSGAILTAASGRPRLVLAVTGPLAPLALCAHLVFVPRFGPTGAAIVTAILAWLSAGASLLAVGRLTGVYPRPSMVLRGVLTTLVVYGLSRLWAPSGVWVLLEIAVLTITILGCLWLLGELTASDFRLARSLLSPSRAS
jgi:O-antigen/teichoic acid export membrane protein